MGSRTEISPGRPLRGFLLAGWLMLTTSACSPVAEPSFPPPGSTRRRLGTSVDSERILALTGDFERGRQLVFESNLNCRACHRFGTGDDKVGPDLEKIGVKLDRRKLLESILDPSKDIDPKYRSYLVETRSGSILSGILTERTVDRLVLRDAEKSITLEARDVKRIAAQEKSLMPDFLLQDLTAQEAADLLEFLSGLK
jgi:putative heme-binding domain-containing protein